MKKNKLPRIKTADLVLRGKRLTLRPFRVSDARDIFLNIQDKRIAQKTLNIPWPYRVKDAKVFIREMQKALRFRRSFAFAIELNDTNEVIGCISLDPVNFDQRNAEIVYWLGAKYWGQGLMTEAGRLVLKFGFQKLKLRRIYGFVVSDNYASTRVLEKLGFTKEGFHPQSFFRFGRFSDSFSYGIINQKTKAR